ncbi:MAG: N-acetyltransferase, partial [Flavobacteriales bacterium]
HRPDVLIVSDNVNILLSDNAPRQVSLVASSILMFPETFSTTRLTLRPVGRDDAAAIFNSYAQDADVTRFLTWRPHTSVEETERFVQMCLTAKTSRTYVIVNKARNLVVGVLDLRLESQARLELGYALARQFWGQGLMTEVLIKVSDWVLGQPSIWRIGAMADIDHCTRKCTRMFGSGKATDARRGKGSAADHSFYQPI